MNHNVTILDTGIVRIGNNVMFAPGVCLYPATHPLVAEERNSGPEYGLPITIGNNCWLGGSCIIRPGVTIGDNSVVGTGSVVIKDVPPNCVVAGNPARVIRQLPSDKA